MSQNGSNTYVDEFYGDRPEEDVVLSYFDLERKRKETRTL